MSQQPSSQALLRLQGVVKRYGRVTALRNVDLEVQGGDFIALFGPNGAGKSTLLRVLASLTKPDDGRVFLGRQEVDRGRIGYVSHRSLLYNDLTGLENLVFYARLYGISDPPRRAREKLAELGLEDACNQLVRGYSRGMKQRLTLARALIHEPRLLLLDEPFTGLDQHGARLLSRTLAALRAKERTVILVTHNAREALQTCDRVLILNEGRLVFDARQGEWDERRFEEIYFDRIEKTTPASIGLREGAA